MYIAIFIYTYVYIYIYIIVYKFVHDLKLFKWFDKYQPLASNIPQFLCDGSMWLLDCVVATVYLDTCITSTLAYS